MEGFLSLPRSAKGGIAVLLAVALLGWSIVAYSAKRQHDDARNLENAIATLNSQKDREEEALAERQSLEERLAAAETELAGSREALAAGLEEKSEVQARLLELEAALADARERPESSDGQGGALALLDGQGDAEGAADDTPALADSEPLRARLTQTMTALSAKSATLQQRERELARAQAAAEAAAAEVEALEAAASERDTLRERLTANMTTLSAKNATVQQKERELARLQAEHDQALASIDALQSEAADQAAAGQDVERLTAKLAALADEVDQEEQRLAAQREELETVKADLVDLVMVREQRAAESSGLTAEIDGLQASLSEKEDAIVYAESELERLNGAIADAERRLTDKETETGLAALKSDPETAEADMVEMKDALAALKGEIDQTRDELTRQTALLDEKRSEVAAAETRLNEVQRDQASTAVLNQSLPSIPIAQLSLEDPAVLPVDPMQQPYPVQTPNGVRLALVHFDLGSAELTPGGLRRAKETAAWIKERGVKKVRLIGATDTIGTKANNLALAERRAQTLFDAFAAEGIDPSRIELISMGEDGGGEVIGDQTAEPLNRCVGVFIEG